MRRLTLTVTPEQAGRTVKSLLRRDLIFTETLYPVITYDLATQTEPPLYGNHFGIGALLGAVNTAYIHLAVGLIIVFSVRKCRI